MSKTKTKQIDEKQVSNGAEELLSLAAPCTVSATIRGTVPLLFHSWNIESIDEKAAAPKNSKIKKTDNVESYVYRTEEGYLAVPGVNLHAALIEAGRYIPDPRSPRKSARDLIKAAVTVLTEKAPFEPKTKEWDYEDRRRVVVQRAGITRTRPAMKEGWTLTYQILINLPEYCSEPFLKDLLERAGKSSGLCDFRPSYGRFQVIKYQTIVD